MLRIISADALLCKTTKMDELIGMVESIPSIVSAQVNLTVFVVLICIKVVTACLLCVTGHGVTGFVPFVGVVLTLVLKAKGFDQTGVIVFILKAEIGVMLMGYGWFKTGLALVIVVVLIVLIKIVLNYV